MISVRTYISFFDYVFCSLGLHGSVNYITFSDYEDHCFDSIYFIFNKI